MKHSLAAAITLLLLALLLSRGQEIWTWFTTKTEYYHDSDGFVGRYEVGRFNGTHKGSGVSWWTDESGPVRSITYRHESGPFAGQITEVRWRRDGILGGHYLKTPEEIPGLSGSGPVIRISPRKGLFPQEAESRTHPAPWVSEGISAEEWLREFR